MRAVLFALALAACSKSESAAPTPKDKPAAEHHEMSGMPPALDKFHAILAPRWHAQKGDERMKNTCEGVPDFKTTADERGRPDARIVLLKDLDARGLTFFTSYDSRKARELAGNPYAALVLFWEPLHRQIRVEGRVETIDPAESDAYFATRPRGSQI